MVLLVIMFGCRYLICFSVRMSYSCYPAWSVYIINPKETQIIRLLDVLLSQLLLNWILLKTIILLWLSWRDQLIFRQWIWRVCNYITIFHQFLDFSLFLLSLSFQRLVVPEQLLLLQNVLLLGTHETGLVAINQLLFECPADEQIRILILYQICQLFKLLLKDEQTRMCHCVCLRVRLLIFISIWLVVGCSVFD